MGRVAEAREMALRAHGDQKYGQAPYSVHLDDVAALVEEHGEDAQVIAFLHDALEDTELRAPEIEAAFGGLVARCVALVTDAPGANRKERKKATYERLAAVDASAPEALALLVKAADRLSNVSASVRDGNHGLLSMYGREHGDFRRAVHREGLTDALIRRIDNMLR